MADYRGIGAAGATGFVPAPVRSLITNACVPSGVPGVFHGERATTDLDALAQQQHALVRGTHSAGAVRRSTTTTVMGIGETSDSAS